MNLKKHRSAEFKRIRRSRLARRTQALARSVTRGRSRVADLLRGILSRSWRMLPACAAAIALLAFGRPAAAAAVVFVPPATYVLPTGGVVAAGTATIATTLAGDRMNIVQGSDSAIVNWSSFSIGYGAAVNFQQPSASSSILNRVTGNDPSSLLGTLTANGKVWLINPAGIMVGPTGTVDVAGFVASTLNVGDADFLANRLTFSATPDAARVQNLGSIRTPDGGNVYLVGAGVDNRGLISAPGGEVLLAAGESVQLVDTGTPGVKVMVTGAAGDVTNLGQIVSEAGRIGLAGALVSNSGVLNASSVTRVGGRIFLSASKRATVDAGSSIDASGTDGGAISVEGDFVGLDGTLVAGGSQAGRIDATANVLMHTGLLDVSGGQGGAITMTADHLLQAGTLNASGNAGAGGTIVANGRTAFVQPASALVDASGSTTGGTISFGAESGTNYLAGQMRATGATGGRIELRGDQVVLADATVDVHGNQAGGTVLVDGESPNFSPFNPTVGSATVGGASVIDASAAMAGNGGSVVVRSDGQTVLGGRIAARGGSQQGNGGTVEVSGRQGLTVGGMVDAGASAGTPGSLLLDTKNIVIDGNAGSAISYKTLAGFMWYGSATELPNGNIVVVTPEDSFGGPGAGAAYLYNGRTGALISALYGSHANEQVGSGVVVLTNGNFVVSSGIGYPAYAGAATWGSGTMGVSGAITAANSLVGHANDGTGSAVALTNGNYVVTSPGWTNGAAANAGAVTWGNGASGVRGEVSAANSLVGSQANDLVGLNGVTALSNGNYVVGSSGWANGSVANAGAATWRDGSAASSGVVSALNSLVGSQSGDAVGSSVTALSNGNYAVASPHWANGAATNAGAVTWRDGTAASSGVVSSVNSLVGGQAGDAVGSAITALSNGSYVVQSLDWANGAATAAGAVTWGSGASGVQGIVSSANSLVGSQANDIVGSGGITSLSNGNYLVVSWQWANGTATNAGAVTWGRGTTGVSGVVSAINSLVGSQTDGFSSGTVVTALSNGNYVVSNPNWANGAAAQAGAVTWGNGVTGISGAVSASNSFVGVRANDYVGGGGVTALNNGNYVVSSPNWANGAATNAGAATWSSGTAGLIGTISALNSLVGTQQDDRVGTMSIALANGNYVVESPSWANGAATRAGAATWGNGMTGITGAVSAANSLVGSLSGDAVGESVALTNGSYLVGGSYWESGRSSRIDALTWGDGASGIRGVVSAANSALGGNIRGRVLSDGNFMFTVGGRTGESTLNWIDGNTFLPGELPGTNTVLSDVAGYNVGTPALSNGRFLVHSPYFENGQFALGLPSATAGPSSAEYPFVASATITPAAIAAITGTGTALVMHANNDITLAANSNIAGSGGNLTLQAGRSIALNSSIATGNGNLALIANETGGVDDPNRDAGAARISVAGLTSIAAGSGNVSMEMRDGAGLVNNAVGAIAIGGNVSANTLSVRGADITLDAGASLAASAPSGDSIVLDAGSGNFANASGSAAPFTLAGAARSLVYTGDSATAALGGMTDRPIYGKTFATYAPATVMQSGSRILYGNAGTPYIVTVSSGARDYGDANPALSTEPITARTGNGFAFSSSPVGDTLSGSALLTTTATSGSGVGIYTIDGSQGTLASDYNLGFTFVPGALTIAPRPITVTAGAQAMTYGDPVPALTHAISAGNLVNGDTLSGSLATVASSSANVGAYPISQGGLTAGGNYALSYVGNVVTIATRPLAVTAQAQSKIYGDADPLLAYSAGGLVNGDALSGNLARAGGENAGSYAINQGSLSAGGNYAMAYSGNALAITPAPLSVNATDLTRTYGDGNPALVFAANGLKFSDTPASVLTGNLVTSATGASNVGAYPITQGSLRANPNYTMRFSDASLAVVARSLSVTAAAQSKVYGDADPVLAYAAGALVNGDTLAGNLARAGGESAGSYIINQGTLSAGSNYAINYSGNALAITPAPLSVSATDLQRIYGDGNPALTFAASGLKFSDTPADVLSGNIATSAAGASNVGAYPITQGSLLANPNYTMRFSDGTLAVVARPLSVVAAPGSKVYGDADPLLAYAAGALVNGDTLSGNLVRAVGENAGDYAINQGTLSAGSNYAVNYSGNALAITPAPLSVSATDLHRIYGDGNPALTFSASGLKFSDTPADVLTGNMVTSAAGASNVGAYPITQGSLLANPNYTMRFSDGTLAVVARPLSVVAAPESKVYGDADPLLAYAAGALANGDTLSGNLVRAVGENAGSYAINQGTLSAGSNYAVTFSGDRLAIAPAPLSVKATDLARLYGDGNPALTFAASGFRFSDTPASVLAGNIATGAAGASNVGAYPITQGSLGANPNYAMRFTDGSITVLARPLSVTAAPESKVYGDADPLLAYAAGALMNGDTLSGNLARAGGENAGSYPINQGTLSAGSNYAINYAGSMLTISPAMLAYAATPASRAAGEINPLFGGTVTGFKFGETLHDVAATLPSFASGADATSAPGRYRIDGNGVILTSRNYELTQAPGNAEALTVTERRAAVPANSVDNQAANATDNAARVAALGAPVQREQLHAAMTNVGLTAAMMSNLPARTDPLGSVGGGAGEFGGAADTGDGAATARNLATASALPSCTYTYGRQ